MKSNSTIQHWFPTPCLMIHCLSNTEKELEGERAGPITSSALQSSDGDSLPWVIRWISFNQTKRFCQERQWHELNSLPVNCWCMWCAAFSARRKSDPSTNYLEVTHHTRPYSMLCRHYLYAICITSNHRPYCHLQCGYESLRWAIQKLFLW